MATTRLDNLPLNSTLLTSTPGISHYDMYTSSTPSTPISLAPKALDVQISGDHYKQAKIQPIEFIHANNIPFCEANVIKYVFRWKSKNGIKDLEKAKHYIDLLIELESKNV